MYFAQVVEESVGSLLALSQFPLTSEAVGHLLDRADTRTLGRLFHDLSKHLRFSEAIERRCKDALRLRNMLAHRFFRDHAVDFMTETGTNRMIDELINATETFQALSARMSALVLALGQPFGITQEFLDLQMQEMLNEDVTATWVPGYEHAARDQ
jgi:hypothetical protein